MVLKLEDRYPGRSDPASGEYPGGKVSNESTPGMNDGTPLEKDWANDREGFFQSMLTTVAQAPDGNVDTALQSQVAEAILTNCFGQTRPRNGTIPALCSGIHLSENAHNPNRSPHMSADLSRVYDACIAWDYSKNRPIILTVDNADQLRSIECWDYDTDPTQSSAWSVTFPATVDSLHAVACDGDYVYIAWMEASGGNLQVSKFDLYPWTGTALWTADTGYDSAFAPDPKLTRLIVANSSDIGMIFGDSGANTVWKVAAIAKSSGVIQIGTGNSTSDVRLLDYQFKITSIGTTMFWAGYSNSGTAMYMCSADLSDPTGSTYTLKTRSQSSVVSDIMAIDPNTIVMCNAVDGSIGADMTMFAFLLADDEFGFYGGWVNPTPWQASGDYETLLGFDGMNVWGLHNTLSAQATTSSGLALRLMSAARFGRKADNTNDLNASLVALDNLASAGNQGPQGKFLFDGRDMWVYFNGVTETYFWRILSIGSRGV